jgi:hypothetical protein
VISFPNWESLADPSAEDAEKAAAANANGLNVTLPMSSPCPVRLGRIMFLAFRKSTS